MIWFVLGIILGLQVGVNVSKIQQALSRSKGGLLAPKNLKPGVTVADTEAGAVGSKTPQQVDWDEEQELKKANPGRF